MPLSAFTMAHPKSEVSEFEAVAPHDQSVDNHTGLRFDNAAVLLELETTESETGISHRLKVSKNGHVSRPDTTMYDSN
jgi:hypothetical protein